MKKTGLNIMKDFIISLLIAACIILLFSVVLYEKISINKVIPQSEEYTVSNEMQEDLNESVSIEEKEVVTTYYIDAAELKKYEKTKEYNKGKKNPFAAESEGTSNNIVTGNDNNIIIDTPTTNTFYGDSGTK